MHVHTHTHTVSVSHIYADYISCCVLGEWAARGVRWPSSAPGKPGPSQQRLPLFVRDPKNTHRTLTKKSYFDWRNADIELVYFAKPTLCLFKDPFKAKAGKKKQQKNSVTSPNFSIKNKVPGLSGHFGQYTIKRLFSCARSVLFCSSIAH